MRDYFIDDSDSQFLYINSKIYDMTIASYLNLQIITYRDILSMLTYYLILFVYQ